MTRSLYGSRPNPYYILAPDFRRNSAGIRVLHMLCDALIQSGQEAYVTAGSFSPTLMTPPLTSNILDYHKAHGIEPIMVYPEVVDGNPYEAEVVVRFLLNTPGMVGGKGRYDDRDILYAFARGLLQPGMPEENVMFLQPVDLSVFVPPADPAKRIPGTVCFYQGRSGSGIDTSRLPSGAVRITTGYPTSWEGLVEIFQTCEFFYSASTSALSAEAALCGCVGVVIPGEDSPLNFSAEETGCHGVAWGDSGPELDRARRTLPLLRASLENQAREFWPALDHFIRVTQEAAFQFGQRKLAGAVATRLLNRLPSAAQAALIEHRLQSSSAPRIAVVIVENEFDGTGQRLQATLDSLAPHTAGSLKIEPLIVSPRVVPHASIPVAQYHQGHLVECLNQALAACSADWFIILQAGDEFTLNGIVAAALDLSVAESYRAIYSDLVMRQNDGSLGMLLRPNLNLDLLLSLPVTMASRWLLHRETWVLNGTFDDQFPSVYELDYILRLIEGEGFAGIGHVSEPLLVSELSLLGDSHEECRAIERHLHARGFETARAIRTASGANELSYGHAHQPKVSILIVVQDDLLKMKLCLALVLENAGYEHYEILFIDQGHSSPEIVHWLADVGRVSQDLMRVVSFAADVSDAQACNSAALEARGDYLLFLDSEVSVLGRDWLKHLLNHALRPEVGAVGPKIVKPDGAIYSAGLHLGLHGPATTPFEGLAGEDTGYLLRLQVDQNYSALSGKCLMVRGELFFAVGGFDEAPDLAPWADVDLCLKLQQAGYLNVWTPRVKVLMTDEKVRPSSPEADAALYARWLTVISQDPVQSPNVSLRGKGYELDVDFASSWQPLDLRPVPVVVAVNPAPGMPDSTKVQQRFSALKSAGLIDGVVSLSRPTLPELNRYTPDVLVLQYPVSEQTLSWLNTLNSLTQTFVVIEIDVPGPSVAGGENAFSAQTLRELQQCFDRVDRVVVATHAMAQALTDMHPDIRVAPSRLAADAWGQLGGLRQTGVKPRVGYVSDRGQHENLALIADVVRALADRVQWVFLGECPEALRGFVSEVHDEVVSREFPAKLASLNLDLAVVPCNPSTARHHGSGLRLLELGACGVPVICSDIEPFNGSLPVAVVAGSTAEWIASVESHIADPVALAQRGDELRAAVHREGFWDSDAVRALGRSWLPD